MPLGHLAGGVSNAYCSLATALTVTLAVTAAMIAGGRSKSGRPRLTSMLAISCDQSFQGGVCGRPSTRGYRRLVCLRGHPHRHRVQRRELCHLSPHRRVRLGHGQPGPAVPADFQFCRHLLLPVRLSRSDERPGHSPGHPSTDDPNANAVPDCGSDNGCLRYAHSHAGRGARHRGGTVRWWWRRHGRGPGRPGRRTCRARGRCCGLAVDSTQANLTAGSAPPTRAPSETRNE
jgi:hypothetical protein